MERNQHKTEGAWDSCAAGVLGFHWEIESYAELDPFKLPFKLGVATSVFSSSQSNDKGPN